MYGPVCHNSFKESDWLAQGEKALIIMLMGQLTVISRMQISFQTQETKMREITEKELAAVSGGGLVELVVGVVVAYVGAAYTLGKDMAQRDNLQCKIPK